MCRGSGCILCALFHSGCCLEGTCACVRLSMFSLAALLRQERADSRMRSCCFALQVLGHSKGTSQQSEDRRCCTLHTTKRYRSEPGWHPTYPCVHQRQTTLHTLRKVSQGMLLHAFGLGWQAVLMSASGPQQQLSSHCTGGELPGPKEGKAAIFCFFMLTTSCTAIMGCMQNYMYACSHLDTAQVYLGGLT